MYRKRFKESRAGWVVFTRKLQLSYKSLQHLQIDEGCSLFTEHIFGSAASFILQSSRNIQNPRTCWWNGECRDARKAQNKAWGNLRKHATAKNLLAFERSEAVGKRILRQEKKQLEGLCIVNYFLLRDKQILEPNKKIKRTK